MQSLGLLGLVFDTGLSVIPLMGHLGCLESHWSVPVGIDSTTLLHNHWFLVDEGGLGLDRMAVTLFSQCDRKLFNI